MHYLDAQMPFYVYKITCQATNEYYWGSRTGNRAIGKQPQDDLWNTYFSSSKLIHRLIKQHGKESFLVEVIEKSMNADEVFWMEQDYIKTTINDPKCLNRWYQDKPTSKKTFSCYNRTKEKHPLYNLPKQRNPNFGSKRTFEQRKNIAINHAPCSGPLNSRARKWELTSPNGEKIHSHGDIQQIVKDLDLSITLLKKYIGIQVPPRSRHCTSTMSRRTVGWMLDKI